MSYIVGLGPVALGSRPASDTTYPDARTAIAVAERLVAETGADREVWSLAERGGVAEPSTCIRYVSAGG